MGGNSGGFRETTNGCLNGTAYVVAGSSAAWACLLLFGLILRGVFLCDRARDNKLKITKKNRYFEDRTGDLFFYTPGVARTLKIRNHLF
jgi:hypothetical protein